MLSPFFGGIKNTPATPCPIGPSSHVNRDAMLQRRTQPDRVVGADGRTRTGTACATAPSRQRVYQFHHIGLMRFASPPEGEAYSGKSFTFFLSVGAELFVAVLLVTSFLATGLVAAGFAAAGFSVTVFPDNINLFQAVYFYSSRQK